MELSLTRAPLRRRPNAEPNDGFPSVDAPFQARENVGVVVARGRMLSSVRPFDAAGRQPPACMGVRGPGPNHPQRARDQGGEHVSVRWVLRDPR